MKFDWHPPKAASNLEKHGVSFDEAKTVFDDPNQLHLADEAHSMGEQRYYCIGFSNQQRLLTVVYTERPAETLRLISAREATRREEEEYGSQSYFT
ncbi:MAG: BrnT family toxin [Acidobacteria bacterium]|nr:BrnT family toxin [Acidobacteriota bacterium]